MTYQYYVIADKPFHDEKITVRVAWKIYEKTSHIKKLWNQRINITFSCWANVREKQFWFV